MCIYFVYAAAGGLERLLLGLWVRTQLMDCEWRQVSRAGHSVGEAGQRNGDLMCRVKAETSTRKEWGTHVQFLQDFPEV